LYPEALWRDAVIDGVASRLAPYCKTVTKKTGEKYAFPRRFDRGRKPQSYYEIQKLWHIARYAPPPN
jgi:hypothetical protein